MAEEKTKYIKYVDIKFRADTQSLTAVLKAFDSKSIDEALRNLKELQDAESQLAEKKIEAANAQKEANKEEQEQVEVQITFYEKLEKTRKSVFGKAGKDLGSAISSITSAFSRLSDFGSGSVLKAFSGFGETKRGFMEKTKDGGASKSSRAMASAFAVGSIAVKGFAKVIEEAIKFVQGLMGNAFLTSSSTRELMLGYGWSQGQVYGNNVALKMAGMSSETDLIYANDTQKRIYNEMMTKFAEKYNQLVDSGVFDKFLEIGQVISEFVLDVGFVLADFIADNKDNIKILVEDVGTLLTDLLPILKLANSLIDPIIQLVDVVVNGIEPIIELIGEGVDWLANCINGLFGISNSNSSDAIASGNDGLMNAWNSTNKNVTIGNTNLYISGSNSSVTKQIQAIEQQRIENEVNILENI